MTKRELLFVAVMILLAVFWLSPYVSADEVKAPVDDDNQAISRNVVFDMYDGSVSTCVCSADPEYFIIFLGPEEESCEAS